jgi:hypothetical protein
MWVWIESHRAPTQTTKPTMVIQRVPVLHELPQIYHVAAFAAVTAVISARRKAGNSSAEKDLLSAALEILSGTSYSAHIRFWSAHARSMDTMTRIASLQDKQREYLCKQFDATSPEEIVFLQSELDGIAEEIVTHQKKRRRMERVKKRNIRRRKPVIMRNV